jgi:hypothetical protein
MPDYRALAQALGTSQPTPQEIERMAALQSPAFGVFPQMQPYRSQQDITASANVPVDLLRGRVAGTRGLFGDVVNQPIPMVRPLQLLSQAVTGQQKYPDTEHYLETMPLKSNTPIGDVAGRIGSLAPINPMPAAKAYGRLVGEALANEARIPILSDITPKPPGIVGFDLRYDPRIKEQERLKALVTQVQQTQSELPQKLSLADLEGRPFITSMSDRTAGGGILTGINDVQLNRPIELQGGQDYMFNNPGQVWASAQAPVKQILENAQIVKQVTGQNPLYIPWRMAPTGGDFAHMTGETMLSYADTVMNKGTKAKVNKEIKKLIPEWSGIGTDEAIAQYRDAPDKTRKALKNMMDVEFRDRGGLNIGEARLAVSDPTQLSAQDAGIQNIGEIFADKPMIMQSGHVSYPRGVPGQGLGVAAEDRNIFELLPQVVKERGIANPLQPSQTDIRALQMKPYAGMITHDLLKALGY